MADGALFILYNRYPLISLILNYMLSLITLKFKISNFMIPYSRQKIYNNDIKEVVKVLKSDFLTKGKKFLSSKKI